MTNKGSSKDTQKRENQNFIYNNFIVGKQYYIEEIFQNGQVAPNKNTQYPGVLRYKNCSVILVTLNKDGKDKPHQYNDKFLLDGKQMHWESQSQNTPTTSHMLKILNNEPTPLFVRIEPRESGNVAPFLYIGLLEYIEHTGSAPVQVLFNVLEYIKSPSPALEAIYLWDNSTELDLTGSILPDEPKLIKKVRRTGQGRMVDTKKKKAIELHAMDIARTHYEGLGFDVVDTSSNCPYDLECFRDEELFRRVEVKGTMSKGDSVYVTSGEVIDANSNECETDLFIVYNIRVKMPEKDQYFTSGSDIKLTENWKPEEENLEPKTYKYNLPTINSTK